MKNFTFIVRLRTCLFNDVRCLLTIISVRIKALETNNRNQDAQQKKSDRNSPHLVKWKPRIQIKWLRCITPWNRPFFKTTTIVGASELSNWSIWSEWKCRNRSQVVYSGWADGGEQVRLTSRSCRTVGNWLFINWEENDATTAFFCSGK